MPKTEINPDIYKKAQKKVLDASNNKIKKLDLSELQLNDSEFSMLLELIIRALPELQILNLQGNQLSSLPEKIAKLSNLKNLNLLNNPLSLETTFLLNNIFNSGVVNYISKLSEGRLYVGQLKEREPDGEGHLSKNSERYSGKFKKGVYHGKGILRKPNGDYYEGEFKEGEPHGKANGKKTYSSGDVYKGEFKDGIRHGNGELTTPRGAHYIGPFKEGRFHGEGELTCENGDVYIGQFKEGKLHGEGKLTNKNTGNVYIGEFKEGKRNGLGKLTKKNGDSYKGQFKDGKPHGLGKVEYVNGDNKLVHFENGKINADSFSSFGIKKDNLNQEEDPLEYFKIAQNLFIKEQLPNKSNKKESNKKEVNKKEEPTNYISQVRKRSSKSIGSFKLN